jgi:carboxyl-terminal processing protease
MRFASAFFDAHRAELQKIETYEALMRYLDSAGLEQKFLAYAASRDGLAPTPEEWKIEKHYMMTQVRALIGRYSKLGDKAFYHIYLDIDEVFKAAMNAL